MSRNRVFFAKLAAAVALVALPALGGAALVTSGTADAAPVTVADTVAVPATTAPAPTPTPTGKDTTGWD
ncbi:hypothetical protein [Streptomyces sp. NPDC090025]|uniref:hypothetical protein n=1 Tax=Streptomyces sp. NPDC090025 TaxID=3365922 RepID=UPI0038349BA4